MSASGKSIHSFTTQGMEADGSNSSTDGSKLNRSSSRIPTYERLKRNITLRNNNNNNNSSNSNIQTESIRSAVHDDELEMQAISCFRGFIIFLMLGATIAAGVGMWFHLEKREEAAFHHHVSVCQTHQWDDDDNDDDNDDKGNAYVTCCCCCCDVMSC